MERARWQRMHFLDRTEACGRFHTCLQRESLLRGVKCKGCRTQRLFWRTAGLCILPHLTPAHKHNGTQQSCKSEVTLLLYKRHSTGKAQRCEDGQGLGWAVRSISVGDDGVTWALVQSAWGTDHKGSLEPCGSQRSSTDWLDDWMWD